MTCNSRRGEPSPSLDRETQPFRYRTKRVRQTLVPSARVTSGSGERFFSLSPPPWILANASRATPAHDSGKFSLSHSILFSALRSLNSPSCLTTTSGQTGPGRIAISSHVPRQPVQQIKQVPSYLLRIGRRYPHLAPIAHPRTVSLACSHDRADRNRVPLRPPVRMISAVRPEGILDRYIPDLAEGFHLPVASPVVTPFTAVPAVKPAGPTAVRTPVGHDENLLLEVQKSESGIPLFAPI